MNEEIKKRITAIRNGEVPDGYVRTEYGVFPSHWHLAELREIAQPITETAGARKIETVSISAGIGFVNQAEKFGKELSGKQYEKYTVLHRGDFSYNKGNSNLFPQGCIYRLNDREIAAVPNVFESFRIVNGDPDYYEQLFLSGFLNHQLFRKINHGVRDDGLLNLTEADFYSCVLPVPPIEEQLKVAEFLASFDQIISLYQRKFIEEQQVKKTFLDKLFPKEGSIFPETRFLGYDQAWESHKLSEVYRKIRNAFVGVAAPYYVDEGHFYLESNNVKDGQINHSTEVFINDAFYLRQKENWLHTGDLVMVQSGHVGHTAVIPEKLNNTAAHALIIFANPYKNTCPYFVNSLFQGPKAKERIGVLSTGNTVKHILASEMRAFQIELPSYAEQQKIGGFFEEIDHLINLRQCELELHQKKKKALMQLLLTGLVRVS